MDERDKKRRRMSTHGESANQNHDKQKTDGAQVVAIDNPANFNEIPNVSQIADLSTNEFKVVKTKLTFVDKSEGIKRFFQCEGSGVHITAPRRFGKSTFMNMLEIFLMIIVDEDAKPISNPESSDNYNMFMNLKLGQNHCDFVKEHCGQYPVISMTFKFMEGTTKTDLLDSMKKAICQTFKKHLYLLETAPDGSKSFKNKKLEDIEIFLTYCEDDRLKELSETDVTYALKFLSKILYTHFNKKLVILIDDTDALIMKGIINNIEDETLKYIIHLFTAMLAEGLKDNEFLERSLVSSSIRLSGVYSWEINNQFHALFLQDEHFFETYGFTRQEVHDLLKKDAFKLAKDFDGVKQWYNGYQKSNNDAATIYNTWSVIRYLTNSIKEQKNFFHNNYYKSGLLCSLKKLFLNHEIQEVINKLIEGKSISILVVEPTVDNILELKNTISYPQRKLNESQVNFFLQLLWDDGLLTAVKTYDYAAVLKIPNLEIKMEIERKCYTQSFFEVSYRLKPENIERYIKTLEQLLLITSDEEDSEMEESEEERTRKCEEAMYNLVNAVSLLFSDDAAIPVNESELHHILFYLAYNNKLFVTQSRRAVVKVPEELQDSDMLKERKRKGKRRRKNERDMCVTLGTVAVIFEFKFLKNEEAENSKSALQKIIERTYFKLLDKEEYKHVKTKIYVGLCVTKSLSVTAHYLVNDADLANAKLVSGCGNK